MQAIQIILLLFAGCGAFCYGFYHHFKHVMGEFEDGMRHALQCAFCDLKAGSFG